MKNDHYRQSLVPFHEILSSTSTRRARRSDATTFERSKRILSTLSMTGFNTRVYTYLNLSYLDCEPSRECRRQRQIGLIFFAIVAVYLLENFVMILSNICVAIVYFTGCNVINFQIISLIFLMKPFFLQDQKFKTKI